MEKTNPSKGKRIKVIPLPIYLFFFLLALLLVLVSSFISLEKREKSHFSTDLVEKNKILSSQEELEGIIFKNLSSHGIEPHNIQQYRDRKKIIHIKIDLPLKKYILLEDDLEKNLYETSLSVQKKDEYQAKEKNFYLWQVEARDNENLIILFSCFKNGKESLEKGKESYAKLTKNTVAVIIDDMGYSLESLKKIIAIKRPITISILPFSPYGKETTLIANENGLECMLHLPLQSNNNQEEKNLEGFILSEMSEEEVIKTLEENLSQIPYIKGINNHMGSKITPDETFMRIILEQVREKNLFFIDSWTTTESIAFRLAKKMGIPSARRHIFLDSISNEDYIKSKLIELFQHAQEKGNSVGICHPSSETLKVLKENIHLVEEYNLELVFASQIIQ